MSGWKKFKPTIFFLLRFFGIYLAGSLLYGAFISYYDTLDPPRTDPITRYVAVHCAYPTGWLGYDFRLEPHDHLNRESLPEQTYDTLWLNGQYAVSVEEGCNGINIMILFVAFVVAFSGKRRNMLLFIPAGLVFIHLANIGRLLLLSLLNVEWGAAAFHFFHKYGFTAVLYAAVFVLWYLWVTRFAGKGTKA